MTRDEVLDLLGKLETEESASPDGIHPSILKELRCEMLDILSSLCNLLLNPAAVPEDWRVPNIILVSKKNPEEK